MPTKPTTTPEWASDGGTHVVEPNTGKKAVGWGPGEEPGAEIQNWFQNLTWLWLDFIDNWIVDNLGSYETDNGGHLTGDIVTTGEADIRHSLAKHMINAAQIEPDNNGTPWNFTGTVWQSGGTAASVVVCPLTDLKVGDRITDLYGYIKDASSKNIVMRGYKRNMTTDTSTQLGSNQTSAGDGTNQTLHLSLNETITDDYSYYLEFEDQDGSTSVKVGGAKVVLDRL
jgi:hypothetical protein